MKTLKKIILVLIGAVLLQQAAQSQVFTGDDGYVEFISNAPLLEFKGTSNNLTGLIDFEENLIDFYVDLNTIDTGIQRRNRDMRNTYLETDTYPFAEFTGKLVQPFNQGNTEKQPVVVAGTFTIHGVSRMMEIEGTLNMQNGGLKLEASWTVRLEDHEIDRPRVLFYELAEEQKVKISILLKEKTH